MRLRDKVAFVLGGGSYVGGAICVRLAEEGARIALLDADSANCDAIAEDVRREGGEALALNGTLTVPGDIERAMARTLEEFGALHILVNAAMEHGFAPVDQVSEETWDSEQALNLKTSYLLVKAAAGHMKKQRYGRIVNLSSTAKDGVPWFSHRGHASHAAARGGLVGLTRALAYELGRYDITVNCVVPGPIEHPASREVFGSLREDTEAAVFPTDMMALRRFGKPEDVANAVLFLASDEAGYITGNSLYVSGGLYG